MTNKSWCQQNDGVTLWCKRVTKQLKWMFKLDNFIREDQLVEAQISEVNVTTTHNAHVHCAKKENVHWN